MFSVRRESAQEAGIPMPAVAWRCGGYGYAFGMMIFLETPYPLRRMTGRYIIPSYLLIAS